MAVGFSRGKLGLHGNTHPVLSAPFQGGQRSCGGDKAWAWLCLVREMGVRGGAPELRFSVYGSDEETAPLARQSSVTAWCEGFTI